MASSGGEWFKGLFIPAQATEIAMAERLAHYDHMLYGIQDVLQRTRYTDPEFGKLDTRAWALWTASDRLRQHYRDVLWRRSILRGARDYGWDVSAEVALAKKLRPVLRARMSGRADIDARQARAKEAAKLLD